MLDPWNDAHLAGLFHESAASMLPRAPLYHALTSGIGDDPALYRLLAHAPETQRLPVLLLASVHALVLAEPDHVLACWYPNLTPDPRSPQDPDLLPTFKQFVLERSADLTAVLATQSTQTNEVGRCSMLLPALGIVAAEVAMALSLIDVGASGGLNLLLDHYHYRYDTTDGTQLVGADSPVVLDCSIRGAVPVPTCIPEIGDRIGIDPAPIDITDADAARWLEACVWPDQAERFHRLGAAIAIAALDPPEILRGDAVALVGSTIGAAASPTSTGEAHPVVTNSWVLNYLSVDERVDYVAELDRAGSEHDFSWVFAEAPALTPGLPWELELDDPHLTVASLATWRSGRRTIRHLAVCHPHGYWMQAL